MKTEPFVIERVFNATTDRVWQAITNKDQMREWYFDIEEFEPEEGFEFTFIGGSEQKQYVHLCKITEVIPGEKLTYSWAYKHYRGTTYVTFELFGQNEKTLLKLTHTGLETFPDEPDFARSSFEAGWTYIIAKSLPKYLDEVDPEN